MNNLNYGVIGNCRTAALISQNGNIEWLCFPDFDSPSIFASMLDREKGGAFGFEVSGDYRITQNYVPHTNILSTQFSSDEGEFVVLDYMPCYRSQDETGHYLPAELYRYIHWIKGKPRFKINYHPAPNYAQGQVILNITPQYIESYCSFDNKDRQYLYASLSLQDIKEKKEIILEKDDSYKGPREVKNAGIDFKVYQSLDAAYSDLLADNLDVLDAIPTSALKTYQNEKNITAVSKPGPSFSAFTISQNLKHFQGEEGKYRRQAIAHAIDRENIANAIFGGTVTPATDFLAPVIKGYDTDLDTDGVLAYDETKAEELWAKADAISPWSGTFRIAYSADGTDKEWVEAAANSIRNALGIDAESYPFATSKELRSAIQERTIDAAFKSGMQSDYPHPEGYLVQAYDSSAADGKGLNNGDYKSDEFDALIDQAAAETDLDKAVSLYQQSERVLLKDLPVIPLWYTNVTAASAKNVEVSYNYMGVPEYNTIVK